MPQLQTLCLFHTMDLPCETCRKQGYPAAAIFQKAKRFPTLKKFERLTLQDLPDLGIAKFIKFAPRFNTDNARQQADSSIENSTNCNTNIRRFTMRPTLFKLNFSMQTCARKLKEIMPSCVCKKSAQLSF